MSKNFLVVYDLIDNKLGVLNAEQSEFSAHNITCTHTLNAVDVLTFKMFTASPMLKYVTNENIVEYKGEKYFIRQTEVDKESKIGEYNVTCRHLSSSLEKQINEGEINLIGVDANEMMTTVLNGSGWTVGTINVDFLYRPLNTRDATIFSNLLKIAETYYAMLFFHSDTKKVDLLKALPDRNILIKNNKNLKSINVNYNDDELVTKLYVRGGQDVTTGNPISIVNSPVEYDLTTGIRHEANKSYITNYKFYLDKGISQSYIDAHPDKFGNHMILDLNEFIEEPALYEEGKKRLIRYSKPKVSININFLNFAQYPEYAGDFATLTPIVGEFVTVWDEDINEKIFARVSNITELDENPMNLQVTLVDVLEYTSLLQQLIDSNNKVKLSYTTSGQQKGSYIKGVLDLLQVQLNSVISGVSTDVNGALLIENTDKTQCLKLAAGIFGISNKKVNGEYVFRTFGTGSGFFANEITLGVLRGGLVHWNVDNVPIDIKDSNGNYLYTLPAGAFIIGNSPSDYLLYFDGNNFNLKDINLKSYNSSNVQTVALNADGSGFLGEPNTRISWGTNGVVSIKGDTLDLSANQSVKLAVGQIGGNNLLLNSSFRSGFSLGWGVWSTQSYSVTQIEFDESYCTTGFAGTGGFGLVTPIFRLEQGKKYTISFEASSYFMVDKLDYMYLISSSEGNVSLPSIQIDGSTTNFNKYHLTFTAPYTTNEVRLLIGAYNTESISRGFRIKKVMLEEGENPSSWSPNPNEIMGTTYTFDGKNFTMKNKNNITTLSADGIVQSYSFQVIDQGEPNHPIYARFYIDSNTISVQRVLLSHTLEPYRSPSKGAASIGQVSSSDGGDHRHKMFQLGLAGFPNAIETPWVASSTGGTYTRAAGTIGVDSDSILQGIDAIYTNDSSGFHHHLIDHQHDLIMGIYEGTIADYIELYVDDVHIGQVWGTQANTDISMYVTTPGFHKIMLQPNKLSRISANIFIKSFVNGQ